MIISVTRRTEAHPGYILVPTEFGGSLYQHLIDSGLVVSTPQEAVWLDAKPVVLELKTPETPKDYDAAIEAWLIDQGIEFEKKEFAGDESDPDDISWHFIA